jgi:hypothetical protein
MSTLVEGYLFSRINGNGNAPGYLPPAATSGLNKGDTLFVPGLRASTNPTKDLNIQGEIAWQGGSHPVNNIGGSSQEAERRQAMAAQFMATYTLPVLEKYKPTVSATYTYLSGDKNANQDYPGDHVSSAKVDTAWDPFNEAQNGGTIFATLFPLSDMHILTVAASANPLEDVTATFSWSGLWSADALTNGSSSANPLAILQPDGGAGYIYPQAKHNAYGLGDEYDVNLTYNYTEDVTFGVSLGWFVPGNVFTSNNNNTAQQALANVAVKF